MGPVSAITERRRQLREDARQRQQEVLPKLRARVRELRAQRRQRVKRCAADCRKRKEKVQRDAAAARAKLRERIARMKVKAREACGLCKVSAKDRDLDALDRTLAVIAQEREVISELRRRAAQMRDPRGIAGGRRAAELRDESDDEVRRNLEDDPDLAALWRAQKNKAGRFKQTKYHTRTEAFLDWVHNHPEALAELRHKQEEKWAREAEEMYATWGRQKPTGRMSEAELADLQRELDAADRWLLKTAPAEEVPF